MKRRHLTSLMALAAALAASNASAQATEINFGFISTESSSNLKTAWQPLLDDLQKATGIKVHAFFATDYAGIIEAMRFNKVQVAWMGNKSGMEAVDRASGEVFAKTVGKDGNEGYYSLLVVHKDSPLKNLDDVIKQRSTLTLGFGDPNSTSGTAVPGLYAFGLNGVDPVKDFKRTVRANHETNLLAVVNKQVDVATNNTENWDRFATTNPDKIGTLREIWRSPQIPSDPLVWRKDLSDATKKQVRDFLLAYGREAREQQILQIIGYSAFRPSSNVQLVPIRQIELARERTKVEGDASMASDERARKLSDIDTRMAEYNRQLKTQ